MGVRLPQPARARSTMVDGLGASGAESTKACGIMPDSRVAEILTFGFRRAGRQPAPLSRQFQPPA